MKILLTTLNSKYVHSNLAIKYLYAVAEKARGSIKIQEFTINNDDKYIFTELVRGEYDVVCFSCYVWNIDRIRNLSNNLKKANPQVRIVLGGPEVSYDSIAFMKENSYVDFIVVGEGELSFSKLMENFVNDEQDFHTIPGLTYRQMGKIFVNPVARPIKFENIPFPYEFVASERDKVVYYESARGCPYQCSYCLSSVDKSMRVLPVHRVKRDLTYFIYKKVMQVKFVDRTFNWDKKRAKEIFAFLIATDNGYTNFHFEICGDLIDDEFLNVIKNARKGLFQFEIGIQSINERTLIACNRHSDILVLFHNIKKLRDLGNIHIHVDLIAGLPYEDYTSFSNSFNSAYELKPDHLQLGFLKLLKGSPIRNQVEQYGYEFNELAPYDVISNKFITAFQLSKLKMIEKILDLYYNRGGFNSSLRFAMEVLNLNPFEFYEEYAYYFFIKGYQHNSHKKEDLYRFFYHFVVWKGNQMNLELEEIIHEVLDQDMAMTLNPDAIKKFKRKGWEIR